MLKKLQETELTYGELFSSSWQLYKQNFKKLVKLFLTMYSFIVAIIYFVVLWLLPSSIPIVYLWFTLLFIFITFIYFLHLFAIKLNLNTLKEKDISLINTIMQVVNKWLPLSGILVFIAIIVGMATIIIHANSLITYSGMQIIPVSLNLLTISAAIYLILNLIFSQHVILDEEKPNNLNAIVKGVVTFGKQWFTNMLYSLLAFLTILVPLALILFLPSVILIAIYQLLYIYLGWATLIYMAPLYLVIPIIFSISSLVLSFFLSFLQTMYYNRKHTA